MPNTIFDLVQSSEVTAFWETLTNDEAPYPAEELFPASKKRGLDLKWIKGSQGLPVVLKSAGFDTFAVPRQRIGFETLAAEMPYFKESMYIDEEMRQELNMVLETGNSGYIDSIMNRIFDDQITLLRGAAAARERMRMMALTTGIISMISNGQTFTFDYNLTHKTTVTTSWSDNTNADPIEDIRTAKETIQNDTGAVITRAMCDNMTWKNLRNNKKIRDEIFSLATGSTSLSDTNLRNYIADNVGVTVLLNDKRYKDEDGTATKFMPQDTFVMFPDGALGNTWFGTTPAESDLVSSDVSNISITDTGVAVVTAKKIDPVNVETIVSMICLPSFEQADQVYILDTEASTSGQ